MSENGPIAPCSKGIFLFFQTLSPPEPHMLPSTSCCPTTCCILNELNLTSNNPVPMEMPSKDTRAVEESGEAPLRCPLTKG